MKKNKDLIVATMVDEDIIGVTPDELRELLLDNDDSENLLDDDFDDCDSEKAIAVRTLVAKFNDAIFDNNTSLAVKTQKLLDVAIKELNEEEKANQLKDWANADDPILTCLTNGGCYALTGLKKDKDISTIEITVKSAIVDLKDLFKVKQDCFADRNWLAYSEAANIALRDYIAKIMNIRTMTDKLAGFKLSATAKMLGISVKDMTTSAGTVVALQKVVDSIMGKVDEKSKYIVTTEDGEAFRYNYSTWGNKAITSVSLSMEASFRKMITRILVKLVNELEYTGE